MNLNAGFYKVRSIISDGSCEALRWISILRNRRSSGGFSTIQSLIHELLYQLPIKEGILHLFFLKEGTFLNFMLAFIFLTLMNDAFDAR